MIERDEPDLRPAKTAEPGRTAEPGGFGLPGDRARELYLAILTEGGRIRMSDLRSPEVLAATAELLDLGLLVREALDAAYTAVNPRTVGGRLSEQLRSAGTRLLVQAQEMPALLEDLTRAYDRAPRKVDRSGEVQHVHGLEEIRSRVSRLGADCREEILAAQPGGGRPPEALGDSLMRTREFMARGGSMRVLYAPSARTDGPTAAYVAAASETGARFRVLGESFRRMFVFDRTTAVIQAASPNSGAAFVEDPAVVSFLVGVFERDWQRAEPVRWGTAAQDLTGLPVHDQIGRLLAQGLTQRVVAGRLGLSERTVAGHISRLRELYDAETLFQLGWLMRASADDPKGESER
ncbi:LuxR family transcriptional regulator [Kitasatospora sp. NPDC052896]|uniref:LuxR family transcriptional regulator n=1 Tax=Kitasatospora sp. NPDC052896 TaxID=3364061 RepID=UPI0037C8CF25